MNFKKPMNPNKALKSVHIFDKQEKLQKKYFGRIQFRKYQTCLFAVLLFSLLTTNSVHSEPLSLPKQGIRSNVLWPIYPGGVFRFAYRRALHENIEWRTDILLGVAHSIPERRDTEGTFSDTSALLGFRQFFASPWHFEIQATYGRGRVRNAVSPGPFNPSTLALWLNDVNLLILDEVTRRRNYNGLDLQVMGLFGYEWKWGDHWSIDLQFGGSKVVSKSDPWPIYSDSSRTQLSKEQIIPVGVVNITYWF